LQELYINKILLGQPKVFNQVEINKFIKGANLLDTSIPNMQKRSCIRRGPLDFCKYTIDALIDTWGRDKIVPGHISSPWTYTDLLPRYLQKLGTID
jgi:hypothetical protein